MSGRYTLKVLPKAGPLNTSGAAAVVTTERVVGQIAKALSMMSQLDRDRALDEMKRLCGGSRIMIDEQMQEMTIERAEVSK